MLFDAAVFVGVDPAGGRKPFTWAAVDARGRLLALADGEIDDALAFLGGLQTAVVAVNAPARPNQGLVRAVRLTLPPIGTSGRGMDMRLAEHTLREHGINVAGTPSKRELCSNWVQAGFDFYRRMRELGFEPEAASKPGRRWVETHPQAAFAALAGTIPLPRASLEGRLQRQLLLYENRLGIHDPMDFFEELTRFKLLKGTLPLEKVYSPEQLDAQVAALTALWVANRPDDVCRVGDEAEGQVWLPVKELKEKYGG